VRHVEELVAFPLITNRKLWKNGQAEYQWPRHDNTLIYPTVLPHSVRIVDRPYHALTEIGHSHLLDRICFESMTTLGVKCFFEGMRADHDMPTVASYAYCRKARCVEDDVIRIYQADFSYFAWAQFVLSGKDNQRQVPKHQDVTKEAASNDRRNRFWRRKYKTRSCSARVFWIVWKRSKTGKCLLKNERANWHPALCP